MGGSGTSGVVCVKINVAIKNIITVRTANSLHNSLLRRVMTQSAFGDKMPPDIKWSLNNLL